MLHVYIVKPEATHKPPQPVETINGVEVPALTPCSLDDLLDGAAKDDTLLCRMLHSLGTGRFREEDVNRSLPGGENKSGEQRVLAPCLASRALLKLYNKDVPGASHRNVAMLLDCGGVTQMDDLMSHACIGMRRTKLLATLSADIKAAPPADPLSDKDTSLAILAHDNVHFLNFLKQQSTGGGPSALNLILKIWRLVSEEDCNKHLDGLSNVDIPWSTVREDLTPKDLLCGQRFKLLPVHCLDVLHCVHAYSLLFTMNVCVCVCAARRGVHA